MSPFSTVEILKPCLSALYLIGGYLGGSDKELHIVTSFAPQSLADADCGIGGLCSAMLGQARSHVTFQL
jgi:hypothetical protein